MPFSDGRYIIPAWQNDGPPAITAEELTAMGQGINTAAVNDQNATLTAAGWIGSSAPYQQTVTVNGLQENGVVGLAEGTSQTQRQAAADAVISVLSKDLQGQTVTFVADGDKPTVDIPITFIIFGF